MSDNELLVTLKLENQDLQNKYLRLEEEYEGIRLERNNIRSSQLRKSQRMSVLNNDFPRGSYQAIFTDRPSFYDKIIKNQLQIVEEEENEKRESIGSQKPSVFSKFKSISKMVNDFAYKLKNKKYNRI